MFVKPFQMPYSLKQLEALIRRLPATHAKYNRLHESYTKRMAGFKGEESIQYPLSFLSEKDYFIFHNLRLFDGQHYFQLDILILSPRAAIILEVKNIAGTLRFDPAFRQMIRSYNGEEEPFPDPITQMERQCYQFESFLKYHSLPKLPVESIVVISSPRTIIEIDQPYQAALRNKVIHAANLPKTVSSLDSKHSLHAISIERLSAIASFLSENHTPIKQDILAQHQLSPKDLVKGVFCPQCSCFPMIRKRGSWLCPSCGTLCQDAHANALIDYALLINSLVSNEKARKFLQISSESTTRKLLGSLNVPHLGENKGRLYKISALLNH
jgi:hypothetical protein